MIHSFRIKFILLLLPLAFCQAVLGQLTSDLTHNANGANQLTIQDLSGAGFDWRIFEPSGVLIGDRIELRIRDNLAFYSSADPAGWSKQETPGETSSERVITYYYTGFNNAISNESFDLTT